MSKKSICDSCIDPGYCCRAIPIGSYFPPDMTGKEVTKSIRSGVRPDGKKHEKMPMMTALRRAKLYGVKGDKKPRWARWLFECSNLNKRTGRCKDYKNRPEMCKRFKPESDELCVHYTGKRRFSAPWKLSEL